MSHESLVHYRNKLEHIFYAKLLKQNGYTNISEAVGTARR